MVTGSEETLPESLPACSLTLFLLPCPSLLLPLSLSLPPAPYLPPSIPIYPSLLLAFSVSSPTSAWHPGHDKHVCQQLLEPCLCARRGI